MEVMVPIVGNVSWAMTKKLPPDLIVDAEGRVPSAGWSNAKLVPVVYIKPPEDGIWDMHLMATPPSGEATGEASSISAFFIAVPPRWCKGVRVHAGCNTVQVVFAPDRKVEPVISSWVPFPWSARAPDIDRDPGDAFPWSQDADVLSAFADYQSKLLEEGRSLLDQPIGTLIGRYTRVYFEGDMVTMDYRPDRLNIVREPGTLKVVSIYLG